MLFAQVDVTTDLPTILIAVGGIVGTLGGTLALVVRWFMKRFDEREEVRNFEVTELIKLSTRAAENMTNAVRMFERFEQQEEQTHAGIMEAQKRLCEAQADLHHELKEGNGKIVSKLDQVGGKLDVLIDLSRKQLNGINGSGGKK